MKNAIYLDANATTPILPEVLDAMRPFWEQQGFGNASSIHRYGQRTRSAIDHAREQIASFLHCRASEVIFTSGGTESDNMALFGALSAGDHLITTAIEHHAILHAAEELEKRGVKVTFLAPTAHGAISAEAVRAALQPNTKLISVMFANNETGVQNPIAEIAQIAHAAGALLHCDAVQGAGKTVLDLTALGCDMLSISGHKMHAPQGIGVLFLRKGVQLRPLLYGGAHERQRRAGTENVPGIVGLGCAASMAERFLKASGEAQIAALRNRLETALSQIPETQVMGLEEPRVCNTLNLRIHSIDADALVIALDLKGVAVSAGSACQSGSTEPSHVLLAMGLTEQEARSCVRLSLSRLTTEAEIEAAIPIITATVERLRSTRL